MFKKKNILVVGDIMLDKYSHGNVTRISPEAPVPIVDIKKLSISQEAHRTLHKTYRHLA